MSDQLKRCARLALVVLSLACVTAGVEAEQDHWYVMEIAGSPAGWQHSIERTVDGKRQFMEESVINIRRSSVEVTMNIQVDWVETSQGPQSMTMRQNMSGQVMTTIWNFEGDEIQVVSEQGGRRHESSVPAPTESWLPPGALMDALQRGAEAGETTMSFKSLLPDFGTSLVNIKFTLTGSETIEIEGDPREVTVWSMENDKLPFSTVMKFDSDWTMVVVELDASFGKVVTTLSNKEDAIKSIEAEGPELMLDLMITPNKPIPDWLEAREGRFRLQTKHGAMPKLPSSGYQRIVEVDEEDSVLQVMNLAKPSLATKEDLENPEYLDASGMVDSNDQKIHELVTKAIKDAGDSPAEKAEAMRAFVHTWISLKNYGTAFASASETARNRTGDCSEHGVLLAAMLRSNGIPSRLATGLVYFQLEEEKGTGVYGWHMWTQAIIDKHWVDLDATLPVPFTVGHVLADTSSLADGTGVSDQWNSLALLGNLKIDVIEVDPK